MLEIERISWLKAQYVVRLDHRHSGRWRRRRFTETMTGDVDGEPYEVQREGRDISF
jgi:hypothetical protein